MKKGDHISDEQKAAMKAMGLQDNDIVNSRVDKDGKVRVLAHQFTGADGKIYQNVLLDIGRQNGVQTLTVIGPEPVWTVVGTLAPAPATTLAARDGDPTARQLRMMLWWTIVSIGAPIPKAPMFEQSSVTAE